MNCIKGIDQCLCIFWNMIQDLRQQIMFFMRFYNIQLVFCIEKLRTKSNHESSTLRTCEKHSFICLYSKIVLRLELRSCSNSTILHIHVLFWAHKIYFLEFLVTCYMHNFLLHSIKMLLGRSIGEKKIMGLIPLEEKQVLKFPAHKNLKCMMEVISMEYTL